MRSFLRSGLKPLYIGKRRLEAIFAVPDEPPPSGIGRSPSLAALLSFVWPGLGQLYTRKRRLAAVFAVPALLVTLLLAYELRRGPVVFAARLFAERNVGLIAVALLVLFGVWRLGAVVHAFLSGERKRSRRRLDGVVVSVLAVVIVVSHAGAGVYLLDYSNAGNEVFNSGDSSLIDNSTPAPSLAPGQTPNPTPTEVPATQPPPGSRVTILFTGVDSGPAVGRDEHLYDSIMVVSYDPKTNSVQMVSVPRDISNFPLYYGGVAPSWMRLNAYPTDIGDGFKSPDSPYTSLVNEVQYLVGVHIDYHAVMDLGGFVKMIDIVGGIDVVNPTTICDCASGNWPGYDWMDGSPYGFYLPAGPQHLDGRHALAYVRSRHSAGDNDFNRQTRQQQVLLALLHKMADPDQILNIPTLIDTVGSSVSTNFPANEVADYVAIGESVPSDNFKQVVLDGPYFWGYLSSGASCLYYGKVADLSRQLFGQDSLWNGKADPADTCGS